MIYDLQKASLFKRLSAYILDFILLVVAVSGFAWALSAILGYDAYSATLDECYAKYETEFNTEFDMTTEEYLALEGEALDNYNDALEALSKDTAAIAAYNMMINLTLLITSISIFLAHLIFEFAVPLFLKNGQTIGKKIFGIAIMRRDGVKISPIVLFIRTLLGKYTLESMIPVLIVILIFFGNIGVLGTAILFLLLVIELILMFTTKTHSLIHDILANTVVVDFTSQMIFDSEEDMLEYQKKIHAENAARKPY